MSWSDVIEKDMYEMDQQSASDWLEEAGDPEYRLAVKLEELREKHENLVSAIRFLGEERIINGEPLGHEILDLIPTPDDLDD